MESSQQQQQLQQQQQQQQQQQGLATPRERIEASMALLTVHLQRDRASSQLLDALGGQSCFTNPGKSGLSETDYFKLPLPQILREINRTPLPPELVQHFQRMKCQCQTGVFPEIQRAWATVDSDLVIWNYHNGRDVVYYDGIENVILAIDLVRPKPSIFLNHVHYLLAVATPSQIAILGVTLAENSQTHDVELHFVNEPLYTYALENIVVTRVKGARNGRIFVGTQDGSLYEFSYFKQGGWRYSNSKLTNCSSRFPLLNNLLPAVFRSSDPVLEICIDNARQILYTLSERGIISVYDLGVEGHDMIYVTSAGEDALLRSVADCAPTQIRRVIHLESLPVDEAGPVHLVAFTQSGARLFLTTCEPSSLASRPYALLTLHVRLPLALPHKVTEITNGLNLQGTALMLDQQNENRFFLISINHFSHFRRANQFIETYNFMVVDRSIWSISPVDTPGRRKRTGDASTRFVIVSFGGCQILSMMTPTEQLRYLLTENHGVLHDEPIKTFFAYYNYLEGCVMCLELICTGDINPQVTRWASDALNYFGGEPQIDMSVGVPPQNAFRHPFNPAAAGAQSSMSNMVQQPNQPHPSQVMSTPFRAPEYMNSQYFPVSPISGPAGHNQSAEAGAPYQYQQQQQQQQRYGLNPNVMGPMQHQQQQQQQQHNYASMLGPMMGLTTNFQSFNQAFIHSFKHDAIFIYFARILRPIFETPLAKECPPHADESPKLALELSLKALAPVLMSLQGLKSYLHNVVNTPGGNSMAYRAQILPATDAMQWKRKAVLEEHNSLSSLLLLLTHTMEVLNLWKVVADHDIEMVSRHMTPELFAHLKAITVKDFILCDKQFLSALATAVVESYLRDGAATATVSEKLKEFCPSIYSNEDALYTRAYEMLRKACDIHNKRERESMFKEALQLCRKISVHTLNLPVVCRLLGSAHYYEGLIGICLWAAESIDPQNWARDFVGKGEPQDDERGRRAFLARKEYYTLVTELLKELYQNGQAHEPTAMAENQSDRDNYDEVLARCLNANDALLHMCIFDWLALSGQQEALLHVRSPGLEKYLQRRAELEPNSVATLDLWCRYHEINEKFDRAVQLLLQMAHRPGSDVTLSARTTYLARAILCAKSGGPSTANMLVRLEDSLDLARIQEIIAKQLPNEREALNEQLLSADDLYSKFAEKYDLVECQLLLLQCANHDDPQLVQDLWCRLINSAHERGEMSSTLRKVCPAFAKQPRFFPLELIIAKCEYLTWTMGYDSLWLADALVSAGVTWYDLFMSYDRLYKDPDQRRMKEHLLFVLASMAIRLVENPSQIAASEQRIMIDVIRNNISTYIVDLQGRYTNPNAGGLHRALTAARANLDRMVR